MHNCRFARTALPIILWVMAALFAISTPASAIAGTKFSATALEEAQKAGKPILIDITAPWCPTCKAQKPILEKILAGDKFKNFVVLEVDFDSQKDVVRSMRATMQSTLIVFKGAEEIGRSVGDTDPTSIETLLDMAL